jgi:hypothetical protein
MRGLVGAAYTGAGFARQSNGMARAVTAKARIRIYIGNVSNGFGRSCQFRNLTLVKLAAHGPASAADLKFLHQGHR